MFSCMDTAIEHLQLSLALLLITKGEDWIFPMIFFPLIILIFPRYFHLTLPPFMVILYCICCKEYEAVSKNQVKDLTFEILKKNLFCLKRSC